ncbi:MAG: iron ABC transporter permease [Prevotellaceae bacterium]|nr:iron ABC transporter permease [Prevotellaceae bacterium]
MKNTLWLLLAVLFALVFVLDILLGSIDIPLSEFRAVLSGEESIYTDIIKDLRLPKAITAVLAGSALSVAGLLLQTFFRNPLAGPDVLGISAGAGLGVALLLMSSAVLPAFIMLSGWGQVISAVLGAVGVMLIVIAVSVRLRSAASLLIVGIMIGSICGSLIGVLQNLSNPDTVKIYVVWTFGSLGSVTWSYLQIMFPLVLLGLFSALVLSKPLNALLLGEQNAQSLGVSIHFSRTAIVTVAALLTGVTTAFTGPIAFIGIAVPHLARGLFQTSDHRALLPATMLCGAMLMLVCDVITQLPSGGNTLPINSVSALFGAPVVIWVILRKK